MSLLQRFKSIYDSPSLRRDADYSQEISLEARLGVFLIYRDFYLAEGPYSPIQKEEWMRGVQDDLKHLHHAFLPFTNASHRQPLEHLQEFLLSADTPSDAFLDFLELSLKAQEGHWAVLSDRKAKDEFVETVNMTLDRFGSPYLLTPFAFRPDPPEGRRIRWAVSAYPKAYLKQSSVVQQDVLQPALTLLSDPAYSVPNGDFRKALERQRTGDFDGVATSCVAALEGVIKVTASKRRLRLGDRAALKGLAQSFLSKSKLPHTFQEPIAFLGDSRNNEGDAHGHESKSPISASHAAFLIGLTATLAEFLTSERDTR